MHCYDAYHERRVHLVGCEYVRGPASDRATWMQVEEANACPPHGNGSVYRAGWGGRGGVCRCRRKARNRCLTCDGMDPLTREGSGALWRKRNAV